MMESNNTPKIDIFDDSLDFEGFDRLVVFYNPESTRNKRKYKKAIGELVTSGYFIEDPKIIVTVGDRKIDIDQLKSNVKRGDLVVGWVGDGYANAIGEALISDELYDKDVPAFFLWGGNGVDLARQTNGTISKKHPSRALKQHKIVEVNPIIAKFTNDEELERYAFSYLGFGNMAELTRQLNDPSYRAKLFHSFAPVRLLRESRKVMSHLPHFEEFVVGRDVIDECGVKTGQEEKVLQELIFSNGSRIAKFGRFALNLNDKYIFMNELEKGNLFNILRWSANLATERAQGEYIPLGNSCNFKLMSESKYHVDGEHFSLPSETKVEVSLSERSLKVVSTLL